MPGRGAPPLLGEGEVEADREDDDVPRQLRRLLVEPPRLRVARRGVEGRHGADDLDLPLEIREGDRRHPRVHDPEVRGLVPRLDIGPEKGHRIPLERDHSLAFLHRRLLVRRWMGFFAYAFDARRGRRFPRVSRHQGEEPTSITGAELVEFALGRENLDQRKEGHSSSRMTLNSSLGASAYFRFAISTRPRWLDSFRRVFRRSARPPRRSFLPFSTLYTANRRANSPASSLLSGCVSLVPLSKKQN